MYERKHEPLLESRQFARRFLLHFASASTFIVASLGLGIIGYMAFEGLNMVDGYLNATMILGGMGPVDMPKTVGGKVFAGTYALYSGLVFLFASAVVLAPLLHRILHRFHVEEKE
ncbi:MAG: hypothetical protein NTX15_01380 [Candidatus Kapabacteria bacterium]|nr:hypothetical protein [Candidatus Kapabacteria bacterium]